jgi:hypothetical protein
VRDITRHGQPGYRRGCRCETCRAGHRIANAEWRAKRRDTEAAAEVTTAVAMADVEPLGTPLSIDFTAPAGSIETSLRRDLRGLTGEPPWRRTLSRMARLNARMLDQVNRHDRLDLVSPLELRTMELLNRLRAVSAGSSVSDDAAAFLSDLGSTD